MLAGGGTVGRMPVGGVCVASAESQVSDQCNYIVIRAWYGVEDGVAVVVI
jgi:hypothetical protein